MSNVEMKDGHAAGHRGCAVVPSGMREFLSLAESGSGLGLARE